ncbi:MAG: redoxin domain-containing protein, partial [Tissierellia bacterium]|nr:redoxin domain-containing protein [Tissierellia bacterium]
MIKKVFIILFSLICITSCQVKKVSHFDTSNSKDALAINHKAPEFEYEDINSNDKINNENLKGKTTILAFYKNNCENCDEEF